MRRRLFLQIYVAFIGVALLCVAVAGISGRVLLDRDDDFRQMTRGVAEMLVEGLPDPAADRTGFEAELSARAVRLEAELVVWDARDLLLGATEDALQDMPPPGRPGWFHHRKFHGFTLTLGDGRRIAVVFRGHHGAGFITRHILMLILVLLAVAAGCYPLARRLTRRLEALQRGAERWGEGDLDARVEVAGRDEVARVAESFNAAVMRVQALIQAQQRMLAHASHELRSPLARLRMALELVRPDVSDSRLARLDEAERDIEELDDLVEELLLHGRLSAGAAPDPAARIDLGALAREEAERAGAEVTVENVSLTGDAALLRRLLRNLLDNGRKYGGDALSLSLECEGGDARLRVCDRGPGVPEGLEDRIFEPFFRAPGQAEGEGSGVGLGLALAREIALHHGGGLRYAPRDGGGSCFELRLPTAL